MQAAAPSPLPPRLASPRLSPPWLGAATPAAQPHSPLRSLPRGRGEAADGAGRSSGRAGGFFPPPPPTLSACAPTLRRPVMGGGEAPQHPPTWHWWRGRSGLQRRPGASFAGCRGPAPAQRATKINAFKRPGRYWEFWRSPRRGGVSAPAARSPRLPARAEKARYREEDGAASSVGQSEKSLAPPASVPGLGAKGGPPGLRPGLVVGKQSCNARSLQRSSLLQSVLCVSGEVPVWK